MIADIVGGPGDSGRRRVGQAEPPQAVAATACDQSRVPTAPGWRPGPGEAVRHVSLGRRQGPPGRAARHPLSADAGHRRADSAKWRARSAIGRKSRRVQEVSGVLEVSPVGVLTTDPVGSERFYRGVLGIERVIPQPLPTAFPAGPDSTPDPPGNGTAAPVAALGRVLRSEAVPVLLKLESPAIELASTETRLAGNRRCETSRQLRLVLRPRDYSSMLVRLIDAQLLGRTTQLDARGVAFADLNGVQWEVQEPRKN